MNGDLTLEQLQQLVNEAAAYACRKLQIYPAAISPRSVRTPSIDVVPGGYKARLFLHPDDDNRSHGIEAEFAVPHEKVSRDVIVRAIATAIFVSARRRLRELGHAAADRRWEDGPE